MSRSSWLQFKKHTFVSHLVVVACIIAFLLPVCAPAFEFTDVQVTEDKGVYRIKFSAELKAHPDYIRYVLGDSAHIYRISPSIIESEVLPANEADEKRVRTRLLVCTSVFCKELERVDSVRMLASGDFEAEIIPSLSEFKSGKATWKISPRHQHSYVVYEAFLEPDFFIPPVVGTQLVIDYLKQEFTTTFAQVEKIARVNARRHRDAQLLVSNAAPKTLSAPCSKSARASLR